MGVRIGYPLEQIKEVTLDLSQAANTYDAITASGDVMIHNITLYVTVSGATFTSLAVQSNQTTAVTILNSTDGARANITAGKNLATTLAQTAPWSLRSGQKIQYTIAGSTGTGTVKMAVFYRQISGGATL